MAKKPAAKAAPAPAPKAAPAPKPQSFASQVQSAGKVLSKNEAMKIADATNKTAAQVFANAQKQGIAIGAGAVNAFNNGKLGQNLSGGYQLGDQTIYMGANNGTQKALNQLQALQGLQMNQGTAYAGYSTNTSTGTPAYNPIVLPRSVVTGVQRVPAQPAAATTEATNTVAQPTVNNWENSVENSNQALIDAINAQIEANANQAQLYMGQIDQLMASMQQQQQGGGLNSIVPYAMTTSMTPADGAKVTTAVTARKKPVSTDLTTGLLVGNTSGTGLNIGI